MKLILHRLTNWRGIRNFEIQPGKASFLFGKNGSGKTAVLESFRSLAEGGADPDSISTWAEEAVIYSVWEIENGDHADYEPGVYEITRIIKRTGFDLKVKGPKGPRIPKEATFIKVFLPKMGFDPLAFDSLTDEERASALKTLLFVPATAQEIKDAASLVEIGPFEKETYENGIGAIEYFHKQLKERATGLRSAIKELDAQIITFRKTISGRTAEDVQVDLSAAREIVAAESLKLTTEEARIEGARTSSKAAATRTATAAGVEIQRWYDEEKAKLDRMKEERVKAASNALAIATSAADEEFIKTSAAVLNPIRDAIATANANVAALEVKAREADQLAGAKAQVEAWEKSNRAKQTDLDRIGVACDQLELLRTNKLATMQLDGMEIKGGRLYIGGVLSSIVNTAERYMRWWEVAKRYAKNGQPIIIDGLEVLDIEHQKLFEESVKKSTVQVLGSMVSQGPLEVRDSLVENNPTA